MPYDRLMQSSNGLAEAHAGVHLEIRLASNRTVCIGTVEAFSFMTQLRHHSCCNTHLNRIDLPAAMLNVCWCRWLPTSHDKDMSGIKD